MKRNQSGISKVLLAAAIVVLMVIVGAAWYALHRQHSITSTSPVNTNQTGPSGSPTTSDTVTTLLVISDSGSTNASGWKLQINTDGSGKQDQTRTFAAGTFDSKGLKQALDATPLGTFEDTCVRSASFGTTETLQYDGASTRGIDCYITNNPDSMLARQLVHALDTAGLRQ